ncbi:MAG TPA: phosphotransferase family protein [Polyangiaceae bacterium]|nr:phosphotransferase family protein [Polyangiaceae bacterium]
MDDLIDRPRDVRPGEELSLGTLVPFLREHVKEIGDADITVQQFPSGHSNLTYFIKAGEHEYVLRRPPFGSKVKSAHDMGREYRILSKLHAVYPLAPEPVVFSEDPAVLGANFYVMRRLKGVILRKQLPPGFEFDADTLSRLHRSMIANLARIHAVDYEKAGLGDLGKPEGYVERQVSGWTKRYEGSQTDDLPDVPAVAKWLAENLPKASGAALIHNDYKFDNVVLDPADLTKIIGVLDWEMSTLGDPCMDLGTFLGYWTEPGDDDAMQVMRWGPTIQPGSLTRRELVAEYEKVTGRAVPNPTFYYVFGMFKTAVVLQQIYYRYKQGLTKDERFAIMIMGVQALARKAALHIELGHV